MTFLQALLQNRYRKSMLSQHVTVNGHDMAYRTCGAGPVLLLVHGLAGSSATWAHVTPALSERFTVVAPDLLGHGDSAKPRGEYSLGSHADGLRDLMNALDHDRATLVGQSFGGGVAMQMAYQYPERCERLVLVNSGGLGREVHPLLRGFAVPATQYLFELVCNPGTRALATRVATWLGRSGAVASPAGQEMWRSYASLADADTRRAFFRTLRGVVDPGGQTVDAANRLYLAAEIPTLIVWGDRDPFIPVRHAHAAHAAIPGSRLEVLDGVGHYPHCEAPDRFLAVLLDFIDSTTPARVSEREWRRLFRLAADEAGAPVRPGPRSTPPDATR